jgi:hypothetical protein
MWCIVTDEQLAERRLPLWTSINQPSRFPGPSSHLQPTPHWRGGLASSGSHPGRGPTPERLKTRDHVKRSG